MTFTVQVENVEAVSAALLAYGARAEKLIDKAVLATAFEINGNVKQAIQRGPKTGRVYKRGKVEHRASAPGQAPATDTGTLVGSIYFENGRLSATVGSRLAYAYYLEFGTARIAPRPSWAPATLAARDAFQRRVDEALSEAAK